MNWQICGAFMSSLIPVEMDDCREFAQLLTTPLSLLLFLFSI